MPVFTIFGIFYFAATNTATKAELKEQKDEFKEDVKKMMGNLMMMATKAEVKELRADVSEIRTMRATKAEVMGYSI